MTHVVRETIGLMVVAQSTRIRLTTELSGSVRQGRLPNVVDVLLSQIDIYNTLLFT